MSDLDCTEFQKNWRRIGPYSMTGEETRLYEIALKCGRTVGFATGLAAATYLACAGSIAVPGVSSVPGALAGLLASMMQGTALCTIGFRAVKPQMNELFEP